MFPRISSTTVLAFLCATLISPVAFAGFGNDEFEDDPSLRQDDDLEWPEVNFPSAEDRGRGFNPGESFEYRAQWGIFRNAGHISFYTEKIESDTEPALAVVTESASAGLIRKLYPLTLKATTILDAQNWRMLRNETRGITRSEESDTLTLFDYDRELMSYEDRVEPEHTRIRELPYNCPVDYSSAFLQLRGMDLKVGERYPIFVSTKGKFYYSVLEVTEKEHLKTDLGKVECFRIEPVSSFPESKVFREGGKMVIWITTDARRIPVRFDVKTSVGTASVRIEQYTLADPATIAQR